MVRYERMVVKLGFTQATDIFAAAGNIQAQTLAAFNQAQALSATSGY